MLRQLLAKQAKGTDTPVSLVQADAHFLPFRDRSVAAIHCVNAVHHFRLRPFLSEASRILAPGGQILIYTRTPEQNERTIWGRLFPGFAERERRLYTPLEIRAVIEETRHLTLLEFEEVQNVEHTSPARLIQQVRTKHYSTLASYPPEEFERALSLFCRNLANEYGESPSVHLVHENLWVTAERNAGS